METKYEMFNRYKSQYGAIPGRPISQMAAILMTIEQNEADRHS